MVVASYAYCVKSSGDVGVDGSYVNFSYGRLISPVTRYSNRTWQVNSNGDCVYYDFVYNSYGKSPMTTYPRGSYNVGPDGIAGFNAYNVDDDSYGYDSFSQLFSRRILIFDYFSYFHTLQ